MESNEIKIKDAFCLSAAVLKKENSMRERLAGYQRRLTANVGGQPAADF
ncbi:MAG: hypothetical protein GY820_08235 [Gammaproteobacteria bacterium]|nr:hypothetical protein [Gammaproteobacteria bacterium]